MIHFTIIHPYNAKVKEISALKYSICRVAQSIMPLQPKSSMIDFL